MIDHLLDYTLPAAYSLLPPALSSNTASAMLLAVGLQESGLQYRDQLGGPAKGFWQFELEGVKGVMKHPRSKVVINDILDKLCYTGNPVEVQAALEHNDTLAACFARCLLWTSSLNLPTSIGSQKGWNLYLSLWRPGIPRRETWDNFFREAWKKVIEHSMHVTLV